MEIDPRASRSRSRRRCRTVKSSPPARHDSAGTDHPRAGLGGESRHPVAVRPADRGAGGPGDSGRSASSSCRRRLAEPAETTTARRRSRSRSLHELVRSPPAQATAMTGGVRRGGRPVREGKQGGRDRLRGPGFTQKTRPRSRPDPGCGPPRRHRNRPLVAPTTATERGAGVGVV